MIEQTEIKNTPFQLLKSEEGYSITMGKYRLTKPVPTEAEAMNKLNTERFNLMFHMIVIVTETIKEVDSLPDAQK